MCITPFLIALLMSNTYLLAKLRKNSTSIALVMSNTYLVAKRRKNITKITIFLHISHERKG